MKIHAKISLLITAVAMMVCSAVAQVQPTASQDSRHNILIFNSYHKEFQWTDHQVAGAREVLSADVENLELYVEYMDTKRIYTEEYLEHLVDTYHLKYDNIRLDAIITTDDNALRFVMDHHHDLFQNSPVSFCGINDYSSFSFAGKEQFTGLIEVLDIKATIDLALKLHPSTRKVYVIVDNTPTGVGQLADITNTASQYENLEFEYIKGQDYSTAEMLEQLPLLPKDSIVLLTVWLRDKNNDYASVAETGPLISKQSSVPVYGIIDMYLGHGIVGGKLLNSETHGRLAAERIVRILKGEPPANIPPLLESLNPCMFDEAQLRRWQIDQADLPEDSIVINRSFSFYETYCIEIWSVTGAFIFLLSAIVFLAANIRKRKRAEEALQESELRFRDFFENAPIGFHIFDSNQVITDVNDSELDMIGYSRDEIVGKKTWADLIVPAQKELFKKHWHEITTTGKVTNLEYKLVHKQGHYVDVILNASSRFDANRKLINTRGSIINVTDRKQAENLLHKSEAYLRSIFLVAPTGIGVVVNRVLKRVNERICEMTGYCEEELLDQNARMLYQSDEDYERVGREKYDQIRNHGTGTVETHWKRKDGRIIDVLLSSTPIDLDDLSQGVTFTALDITERKQTEDALQESETQFRELFDNMSSGVAVYEAVENGRDFVFKNLNRTGEHINKVKKEDVVGKKITEAFPGIEEFGLLDVFREVYKTGKPQHYPVTMYKDNRYSAWYENYVYKLPSGEIVAVHDDVTERKQSEEEIENLSKFPSENPNPVIRISSAGVILYSNDAAENTLKAWDAGIGEVVSEDWMHEISNALEANSSMLKGEMIADRFISFEIAPVLKSEYVNLYGRDITERKQAEEERESLFRTVEAQNQQLTASEQQLKVSNRQLFANEQQLKASNQQLSANEQQLRASNQQTNALNQQTNALNQQLEANQRQLRLKNEELQSIVYISSHDLKTPLININGFSEMLIEHCGEIKELLKKCDMDGDTQKEIMSLFDQDIPTDLEYIRTSTDRMKRLIEGLLQVSRIGTVEIESKKIDMNGVVSEILDNVKYKTEELGAEIVLEDLPACTGDKHQITQVLTNLIDNALKYLSGDRKGRITVTGKTKNSKSIYCIEDNGIGIKQAYQDKIFEIYHRLNPRTSVEGDGLGLTIVRRILDRHKGSIWVESEAEKGSKFFVSIPT